MRHPPAQASTETDLQDRDARLMPGRQEEVQASEKDQHLANHRWRQDNHALDADALIDGYGKAFAADHLPDLVADILDRLDRPPEFGQLHLQIGPQLRQPGQPEGEGRGQGDDNHRDQRQEEHNDDGSRKPGANAVLFYTRGNRA